VEFGRDQCLGHHNSKIVFNDTNDGIVLYHLQTILLIYLSSGLSTDVFPNKTNINTLHRAVGNEEKAQNLREDLRRTFRWVHD